MTAKTTITFQVTGPDGTSAVTSSEQESILIGSGMGAALRVVDPAVSSLHCMIKVEDGKVALIDLGSQSGTLVHERSVREPVTLASGAVITLGASRIKVTFGPEASSEAAARAGEAPVGEDAHGAGWLSRPGNATERDRVLEISACWGDAIVAVRQLPEGCWATIGDAEGCDVIIAGVGERLELARAVGGRAEVRVPAGAGLLVFRPGAQAQGRDELVREGRLSERGSSGALTLGLRERALIELGGLSLGVRFVRPPPRASSVPLTERDFSYFKIVTLCLMVFLALTVAIAVTPRVEGSGADDIFARPSRYVKLVTRPAKQPDLSRFKAFSGAKEGQKVKEAEGRFGKQAQRPDADPSRRGASQADKREQDRRKVGLLVAGLFGGGASSSLFGAGGLGAGINNAIGGIKAGAGLGDAQGLGGLGSRGAGSGGGGTGLGLGGLGTRGVGEGAGGSGTIDLGGRGKETTRIIPGKTTVIGGLDREVILKVIRRHQNEIKFCYEGELKKDPALAGKVAVAWTIDASGLVSEVSVTESSLGSAAVERCILERIRRWRFPQPEGGGVVAVTFPWIFKAAGDEPVE